MVRRMIRRRRTFILTSALALAAAASGAKAQFGGRSQRSRGDGSSFAGRSPDGARGPGMSADPAVAIERELLSLRNDLKPTADASASAKTAEQEAHSDIKSTRPPDGDGDADDK